MGFFDKYRVIMREFLDDADFYEDGDLDDDDGLVNLFPTTWTPATLRNLRGRIANMDAVILNYRAGRLQQFAGAMRDRFTAKKGKYEIVFTGNDWKEDSVNVFRGNGRGWDLIMLFIIRWIVMARRENEDLSILIRPTDRRACNE